MPGTSDDKKDKIIGDGSFVDGVNTPKLGEHMIPIVYDSSVTTSSGIIPAYWREAKNEKEWYNYANKKWANAVTEDGSMWVWIPRYEYKIVNGEGTKVAGEIDVRFIPVTTNSKNGGITSGYKIHPAFEDGSVKGKNNYFINGEWDQELSGIWVAKFEASRSDATSSFLGVSNTVTIRPDVSSYVGATIGATYTASLNMFAHYNSHMLKNSEWGATVYFAQSKYGTNNQPIEANSNSGGILAGEGNYKAKVKQSSTGTVEGIYDLSGGAWEATATYITNGDTALNTYASSMVGGNTAKDENGYKTKSSKYATVYPFDSASDTYANNWRKYNTLKSSIYGYGDVILETSISGYGMDSWSDSFSDFPCGSGPFFARGGQGNASNVNMFAFTRDEGKGVTQGTSFRVALAF